MSETVAVCASYRKNSDTWEKKRDGRCVFVGVDNYAFLAHW